MTTMLARTSRGWIAFEFNEGMAVGTSVLATVFDENGRGDDPKRWTSKYGYSRVRESFDDFLGVMSVDAKLVRAFLRYERSLFPSGGQTGIESLDREIMNLHADLAEYDAAVAGAVERLVQGFAVPAEFEHLLNFDDALLERASALVSSAPEDVREHVSPYETYLRRIKRMLDLARPSSASNPSSS